MKIITAINEFYTKYNKSVRKRNAIIEKCNTLNYNNPCINDIYYNTISNAFIFSVNLGTYSEELSRINVNHNNASYSQIFSVDNVKYIFDVDFYKSKLDIFFNFEYNVKINDLVSSNDTVRFSTEIYIAQMFPEYDLDVLRTLVHFLLVCEDYNNLSISVHKQSNINIYKSLTNLLLTEI